MDIKMIVKGASCKKTQSLLRLMAGFVVSEQELSCVVEY
jgi:hypothetical protein